MAPLPFLTHLKRLARLPIRPGDSTQPNAARNIKSDKAKRDDEWEVPSIDDAEKVTDKQMKEFNKRWDALPDDAKKRLNKFQKDHGLTRNQLILAALKQWAPQYVGAFKAAMFFGIV